ncbi:MAG: alpha/beta hydrolase [Acidobacteriia bacterium]|jgi:pimeloyl-ACP methyl ester carboxylesterase|nr:alpha/beta hydrolase [Terriglobia bacterium]
MAINSRFLKTARRFAPAMAAAVLFTVVAEADSRNKVQWARSTDGVRIAYEVRGQGALALVFVHGWSCNRSFWAGQMEPFSRHFKVVAVDLAGHGDSGRNREKWTIQSYGEDVAAVVKKLNLKRVILIGHSMGGDVIPEAALRLPGRVLGLIWLDTYKKLGAGRSPEEVQAFVAKFRPNFSEATRTFVRSMFVSTSDPALVERVALTMSSAPPSVALPSLDSAFSYSREMPQTLERLHLPVIAINPDNAPTDIASLDHHSVQVIVMPGVGHFLMMEDPQRFNGLLSTAIGRLNRE